MIPIRFPTLALAALGATFALAAPQEVEFSAGPVVLELPALPPVERAEPYLPPEGGRIERDAAVADRLTDAGQSVSYAFRSDAGELSLFELPTWGYARGWWSRAGLRVLDAAGDALVDTEREGGVVYRPMLAFVAPAAGEYRLEISALDHCFRYVLVRHSGYPARDPALALALQGRELVHDYLASGDDSRRFTVELAAGEEAAFKVLGTREEARKEHRSALRGFLPGMSPRMIAEARRGRGMGMGMGTGMEPRMGAPGDERRAPPARQFQAFELQVLEDGTPRSVRAGFVLFRAPRAGTYELLVSALEPERPDGGLFDLTVTRGLEKIETHGVVVDVEDDELAGVELVFLREPDYDELARTETDARGAFRVELPAGPYTIRLVRSVAEPGEAGEPQQRLIQVGLEQAGELNLLWTSE